ncbi:hypothetical protein [Streptomyces lydicus]|uniref:hypothetical protein n=1 Tax=Streptomyces lydicus TaxID=47763 RepID=UPI0013E332AA|nr:hypothetical protein [Streptomyces lydicus]
MDTSHPKTHRSLTLWLFAWQRQYHQHRTVAAVHQQALLDSMGVVGQSGISSENRPFE